MKKEWKDSTKVIRKRTEQSLNREHSSPIYMTSSFTFEDTEQAGALFQDKIQGNIYTRFSNPNTTELADKLCILEETEAGLVMASGMAAMFCSMAALLSANDHVLASRSLFGSTHQILTQIFPKWGIEHSYADIDKPETWESLIQKNTKLIFVETPSNPGLDLIDLEWLGKLAEAHKLILVVDNCFATPVVQKPSRFGAHLIAHSATKFIDGQGRAIGGAILGKTELIDQIRFFIRHTGPSLSPFNAWLLAKSLETLELRMDKHGENALQLAKMLQEHPKVHDVKYPFLESHPQHALAKKQMKNGGGLITFKVKGGLCKLTSFCDNLDFISFSSNLGDTRTIITPPAVTTHSKLSEMERKSVGITEETIRVSVGLENVNDIFQDIDQALNR